MAPIVRVESILVGVNEERGRIRVQRVREKQERMWSKTTRRVEDHAKLATRHG